MSNHLHSVRNQTYCFCTQSLLPTCAGTSLVHFIPCFVIKVTFESSHVTQCLSPFSNHSSDPRIIIFQGPSWSGPCSCLQPPCHFSSHLFCLCTYCFLFPEPSPPSHLHPILSKSESTLSPQPTHLPSLVSVTTSSPPPPSPTRI